VAKTSRKNKSKQTNQRDCHTSPTKLNEKRIERLQRQKASKQCENFSQAIRNVQQQVAIKKKKKLLEEEPEIWRRAKLRKKAKNLKSNFPAHVQVCVCARKYFQLQIVFFRLDKQNLWQDLRPRSLFCPVSG